MMRALEHSMREMRYQPTREDREFLKAAPPKQLRDLLLRLASLSEMSAKRMTTKRASEYAGVSVATMFRIKRIWKDKRVRSLALVASWTRASRGYGKSEELLAARRIATRLAKCEKAKALSLTAFSALIRKVARDSISPNGAETIARDVRREMRLSPNVLKRDYGAEIIVDTVAVSLVVKESEHVGEPEDAYLAILALVVERVSGLRSDKAAVCCAAGGVGVRRAGTSRRGKAEPKQNHRYPGAICTSIRPLPSGDAC
jgi:hypothetical protein